MFNKVLLFFLILLILWFPVIIIGILLSRTLNIFFIELLRFTFISLLLSLLVSLFFLIRTWAKIKVYAVLPLLITLLMSWTVIAIIPSLQKSIKNYYLFVRDVSEYRAAVDLINETQPIEKKGIYILPAKYRYLSRNGKVTIFTKDNERNIVFYFGAGPVLLDMIVYTSSGNLLPQLDKSETFGLNKIRPHWYFASLNDKKDEECVPYHVIFPWFGFAHKK